MARSILAHSPSSSKPPVAGDGRKFTRLVGSIGTVRVHWSGSGGAVRPRLKNPSMGFWVRNGLMGGCMEEGGRG